MSKTPKLPSAAEWREMLIGHQFDMLEPTLRERGLIAPEPEKADPSAKICKEIERALSWLYDEHQCWMGLNAIMDAIRPIVREALAESMELRPELTRAMVRNAVLTASRRCNHSRYDERFETFLHTALTEARDV